jgi:hypothetical protein
VLGGGLTGLTTAYYLTKFLPEAKITIYEGSGRLGGWIDTETVEVRSATGDKGTVRFERGARTVQPKTSLQNWDDAAFMELVGCFHSGIFPPRCKMIISLTACGNDRCATSSPRTAGSGSSHRIA